MKEESHETNCTGAGISAESGMPTFRDADGLWEGHDVYEVASIDGWRNNPSLILDFYNERRKQASNIKPNKGHFALVDLEEKFDVTIITQNKNQRTRCARASTRSCRDDY